MALTRCTARFGELAAGIEEHLVKFGCIVPSAIVDELLRRHIHTVAIRMRIQDRSALFYAPDELCEDIARGIAQVLRARRN